MTNRETHYCSTKGGLAVLILLLLQLVPVHSSRSQNSIESQIARLFERDSVTILITDSGLGGLSVCADLEARLSKLKAFKKVRLIFVNALPDIARTYNSMPSTKRRAGVFDKALDGFVGRYRPDAILIACNTLSAVYPETQFAQHATIPVIGIIDVGASMIAERMKAVPNSSALLFGTATTISSGMYEQRLGALGVPPSVIVTQPCPMLESEIQTDPVSDAAVNLVDVYVEEALEKFSKPIARNLVVGLCCSHYGYSLDAFDRSFRQQGNLRYELVNPNKAMAALFENDAAREKVSQTVITVEVASRVEFTPQEVSSISHSVSLISEKTAQALKHYTFNIDLFRVN